MMTPWVFQLSAAVRPVGSMASATPMRSATVIAKTGSSVIRIDWA
jgi:hypothetical protein